MIKIRKSFTLIELLVAMVVLSLLVMLMLQLFGGAQKLWVANEKRSNIYADARVAMELMAELIGTVQFSYGEKLNTATNVYENDSTQNMIFSLDTTSKSDNRSSSSIIFLAKTSRDLPKNSNNCRFISFRLGSSGDSDLRGKLLMLVLSDKPIQIKNFNFTEDNFYKLFPPYDSDRGTVLGKDVDTPEKQTLKGYFNGIVDNFKSFSGDGEYEYCQVIAENVVSFKITAYLLDGSGDSRKLKIEESNDLKTPPYMLAIQLTMLDRDSYNKWLNISNSEEKDKFLTRHQRTFTRSVFIGNRWELTAE